MRKKSIYSARIFVFNKKKLLADRMLKQMERDSSHILWDVDDFLPIMPGNEDEIIEAMVYLARFGLVTASITFPYAPAISSYLTRMTSDGIH